MRISEQNVSDARLNSEHQVDDQKTSNRFSQVLKSNEQAHREKENDVKSKKDTDDSHKNATSSPVPALPTDSLAVSISSPVGSTQSASSVSAKSPQPVASASPQIEKLATEVGHQIDIFKQEGSTQAINITFDSKTLEGLQVQIRQQGGELAIRFVTQSDNISKLISQHTGELKEALTDKGVKIRNIAVTNTLTSPAPQRSRDAGA